MVYIKLKIASNYIWNYHNDKQYLSFSETPAALSSEIAIKLCLRLLNTHISDFQTAWTF